MGKEMLAKKWVKAVWVETSKEEVQSYVDV